MKATKPIIGGTAGHPRCSTAGSFLLADTTDTLSMTGTLDTALAGQGPAVALIVLVFRHVQQPFLDPGELTFQYRPAVRDGVTQTQWRGIVAARYLPHWPPEAAQTLCRIFSAS
ncbi:hypothetical protein PQI66_12085 [Corynebacterium sp. USCH3]|uniref:hypothetical protein n=1 Tax=Corynebacterium sp. USCH3 TaxID=3024840 RepID=UPI0030A1B0C8